MNTKTNSNTLAYASNQMREVTISLTLSDAGYSVNVGHCGEIVYTRFIPAMREQAASREHAIALYLSTCAEHGASHIVLPRDMRERGYTSAMTTGQRMEITRVTRQRLEKAKTADDSYTRLVQSVSRHATGTSAATAKPIGWLD